VSSDPYSGYLFGKAYGGQQRSTVNMCESFCVSLYDTCGAETLNWPGGNSPFGFNRIQDGFRLEQLFCKIFAISSTVPCYDGTSYTPSSTPVPAPGQDVICIEPIPDVTNALDPQKMIVSIVDPHDSSGLLYLQYKARTIRCAHHSSIVN
jgi:hypothetical protein